jgi:hypothetical protein
MSFGISENKYGWSSAEPQNEGEENMQQKNRNKNTEPYLAHEEVVYLVALLLRAEGEVG